MKKHSPSAARNKDEILPVLLEKLPRSGLLLEIASGTGQQAVHFAAAFPDLRWQPSEPDPANLASIAAWSAEAALPNLLPPLQLDVHQRDWPVPEVDAVYASNMIHITPWETCLALLEGAARCLKPGAPLLYYGAFFRRDRPTAPSNLDFDRSLRARNPAWGVRRLEDVREAAADHGLAFEESLDMPNNNFLTIFRRQ
ncbi:MAG TPA: DUF938 domain-containing protein [Planctomycetes bacterium]|nr:DUF938 domain-containing protein [Planctomycetota bacterium]